MAKQGFFRRKKKGPPSPGDRGGASSPDNKGNAAAPAHPNSAAALPPRPKEIAAAREALAGELGLATSSVVVGHGFADISETRGVTGAWRLFVFTDDATVKAKLPAEFQGFPVSWRPVPVSIAGPAWGKVAKRAAAEQS